MALQDMLGTVTDPESGRRLYDPSGKMTQDEQSGQATDPTSESKRFDPSGHLAQAMRGMVEAIAEPQNQALQQKEAERKANSAINLHAATSGDPDLMGPAMANIMKEHKVKPEVQGTLMRMLGVIGKVAGGTLAGAATLGAYPERKAQLEDQARQQQFALQRERQQSQLVGEREIGQEQRRQAWELDPRRRQAQIDDYRQQMEAKGTVDRIEQGRILSQYESEVNKRAQANPKMDIEDIRRDVATGLGLTYHAPQMARKIGETVAPDPASPTGWRKTITLMDGSTIDGGPAPVPTSEKKPTPVAGRDIPLPSDVEAQRIRIAKASAAARAAATGSVSDTDIKDVAAGIMEGTLPPDLSGFYRNKPKIEAELKRNGFDLTQATADWKAIQRYLTTLNGTQQIRLRQAITFTNETLPQIEDAYAEWKKQARLSGFKLFNRGALTTMKNLPGPAGSAATQLDALIGDFTSELGTVYKGGNTSTDESLKLAATNLQGDWNEETFNEAIARLRRTLAIRNNSISMAGVAGVSADTPYKKELEGGGGGGGPTPVAAPATPAANPANAEEYLKSIGR